MQLWLKKNFSRVQLFKLKYLDLVHVFNLAKLGNIFKLIMMEITSQIVHHIRY